MDVCFIFDLDGTLFRTEEVAIPAFRATFEQLLKNGLYAGEIPSDEQIISVFGMTTAELWGKLLPFGDDEDKALADDLLRKQQLILLEKGAGQLFAGVAGTLAYLQDKGAKLFIASNGGDPYVMSVVKATKMGKYFEGIYTAGRYKTAQKEQLVKIIIEGHNNTQFIMVGDRRSDVTAGKANGLFVIGCNFGFGQSGELEEADVLINDFSEIQTWYDVAIRQSGDYNNNKGQQ